MTSTRTRISPRYGLIQTQLKASLTFYVSCLLLLPRWTWLRFLNRLPATRTDPVDPTPVRSRPSGPSILVMAFLPARTGEM